MIGRLMKNFAPTALSAIALSLALSAPLSALEARKTPHNTMLVTIDAGDTHMTKTISLPLNKAIILDLPVDARDALVSNPKIADAVIRTPRRIYLMGMSVGQTNAFFFDGAGQQILNLEIQVERDFDVLAEMYRRYLPGATIKIDAINDHVVLTGSAASPSEATQARELAERFMGDPKHVLTMISVESSEQVLLKVRIAEMQRTLAKQLGVDLEAAFSVGDVTGVFAQTHPFSLLGRPLSDSGAAFSAADGDNDSVDGAVRALERVGLVKTLAEPNLTAVSGEGAKFLAGGEFPVPVRSDDDGDVTLEFKPFGVGLGFTPVVLSSGRISLKISTEVSELTSENSFVTEGTTFFDPDTGQTLTVPGLTIPGLNVRRAETTVELPSGGSLVMAGLLQDSMKQNIDGIPGMKDVPVLGALFRSRDFRNNETELVVLVTPYLVKPVQEKNLALPTDGFAPPSDLDTILLGRLNGVYGNRPGAAEASTLKGPMGFVMN